MGSLDGRRVVVTRRSGQASSLVEALHERGATVIEVPAIEIAPPPDLGPLDAAAAALDRYDWIVLTSTNAVTALVSRLTALGVYPKLGSERTRVASVGPATTAALRASFPEDRVALEPAEEHRAGGLLAAFSERHVRGKRILLPTSTAAREELAQGLRQMGAVVEVIAAYATHEPPELETAVGACLDQGFDLVLFASPSAAEAFARAAGDRARGVRVAVIGPTTEAAARSRGFDVRGVAHPSTTEALVAVAERILGHRS